MVKRAKSVTISDRVVDAGGARSPLVKATVIGGEAPLSNVMQGVDETEQAFIQAGGVEPPYNFGVLVSLYEMSNSLRQNVDAYATNIDGFGHTFKPSIDLDASDADQRIEHCMYLERRRAAASQGASAEALTGDLVPTPDEVRERKMNLVQEMRLEKARLEQFFDFCCEDMSFVAFRRALRQDLEVIGNTWFEVLRDGAGEVCEFTYVPGFTIRLLPLDKTRTQYETNVKITDLDYEAVSKEKAFRRYVQILENRTVFFKEYGDPRVISRRSGKVMDAGEGATFDDGDGPATELVHIKVHSPRSSYGVPRWIGNLLSVFGSRQAEEVNHSYFENKSIPPLAVLVSGGKLGADSVKRLTSFVDSEIKGKKNFHKILVLEATSQAIDEFDNQGTMKIDIKPLTDSQQKDALFGNYDERNMDKVGMAFRLPRMLRGDIRDFNRASAEAALEFAEQQVFGPERTNFDWLINRRILSELGIRFWKFESNTPTTKDPAQLADIIAKLTHEGLLTPEEGRELAQGVFNVELPNLTADWVKQPLALTLAGIAAAANIDPPWADEDARPGLVTAPYDNLAGGDAPAEGEDQASSTVGAPAGKADLSTSDLQTGGGIKVPAQTRRLRRVPPPTLAKQAEQLVVLRNLLLNVEAHTAQKRFLAAKARAEAVGEVG